VKAERHKIPLLPPDAPLWFPDPALALPSGLLAAGGDLRPERIVLAYSQGIFPWYTEDSPILWWSPDPRCVLFCTELHVPRRLERLIRSGRFCYSFDQDFEAVIRLCAETPRPDQNGTWLVPEMMQAYTFLHRLGLAHSVEAWQDGELVGGIYGLSLGRVFFGESMFHLRPDASKAALVHLVRILETRGFVLLDCQQTTPHMTQLGAREISRLEFLSLLRTHVLPASL